MKTSKINSFRDALWQVTMLPLQLKTLSEGELVCWYQQILSCQVAQCWKESFMFLPPFERIGVSLYINWLQVAWKFSFSCLLPCQCCADCGCCALLEEACQWLLLCCWWHYCYLACRRKHTGYSWIRLTAAPIGHQRVCLHNSLVFHCIDLFTWYVFVPERWIHKWGHVQKITSCWVGILGIKLINNGGLYWFAQLTVTPFMWQETCVEKA